MIALFSIVRAIHIASLMIVFGGCAYLLLLKRSLNIAPKSSQPLLAAFPLLASLALLTAVLWLCLAASQMSGDWPASAALPVIGRATLATHFGHVFAFRIAGLVLLSTGAWLRAGKSAFTLVLSGALLASLGLTGHAAASAAPPAEYLRAFNDGAHLLAAGFWMGGLLVLALLLWERWNAPAGLLPAVRLFSIWGTYAVALLVVSGVINAMCILTPSFARIDAYRLTLAVKVALAAAMILLAILNRWRFAPALRDGPPASHAFGATVAAELILGALVIGAVGYLGLLPPQ